MLHQFAKVQVGKLGFPGRIFICQGEGRGFESRRPLQRMSGETRTPRGAHHSPDTRKRGSGAARPPGGEAGGEEGVFRGLRNVKTTTRALIAQGKRVPRCPGRGL